MKLRGWKRNKKTEDKRLALLAQELGIAMMVVLVNDYGFSSEKANEVLGKVLSQAKQTREMIATNGAIAAQEKKSISTEEKL